MHDIFISGLIAAIVIIQIMVALSTTRKISLFKDIIPQSGNFETIKVYIPESQIKNVTVDYILENLQTYTNPSNNNPIIEAKITETYVSVNENKEDNTTILTNNITELETIDYDALIWISKENEEKKIRLKLLKKYELLGWKKIE